MLNNERLLPFVQFLPHISPEYHDRICQGLDQLPDYFFIIAPSSSGKYHPVFDHGYGGLVRHVVMAMKIALDLIRADFLGHVYTQEEKDIILIALLFHDALKDGDPYVGYTTHEHPLDSARFCFLHVVRDTPICDKVLQAISSHMGRWTVSDKSDIMLPKPVSEIDHLVHMADFLASRTYIMYDPEI